jgi:hypothetical protein
VHITPAGGGLSGGSNKVVIVIIKTTFWKSTLKLRTIGTIRVPDNGKILFWTRRLECHSNELVLFKEDSSSRYRVARCHIFVPKIPFLCLLEGLGVEQLDLLHGILVYFKGFWCMLLTFWYMFWSLGVFLLVLVYFAKENLATLSRSREQSQLRRCCRHR